MQVPLPSPGMFSLFRKLCRRLSCFVRSCPLTCRQVPCLSSCRTQWTPPSPWRWRCSRYLPLARRSATTHPAHYTCGADDLAHPGCFSLSWGGTPTFVLSSMPPNRDACGMPSNFALPIRLRHPDLAQLGQSRSCPLPAIAVMRSDHAHYSFQYCSDGSRFRSYATCLRARPPDIASDRFPTSVPSAGLRSHFQIHTMAAYPCTYLSRAPQAIGTGHRMARRRHPLLDCSARPAGLKSRSEALNRMLPIPGEVRASIGQFPASAWITGAITGWVCRLAGEYRRVSVRLDDLTLELGR